MRIRRFLYAILASVGLVGGMLMLSAGGASASVLGHEHGYGQPVQVQQHRDRDVRKLPCRPHVQQVVIVQHRQPCKPRPVPVVQVRKPCKPRVVVPVVSFRQHKPCKPVVVVERKPCKPVPAPKPVVMVHRVKTHKAVCTNADVRAEKRLLERAQHHKLTKAQLHKLNGLFKVCGAGRG